MIIALDLETTWLDKLEDSIIEVALVKFDEKTWQVIDKYSSLVNPWFAIPEVSRSITWISDEDVKDAPLFEDIIDKIEVFIWDFPILGHNTQFDKSFLVYNGVNLSNNLVLDTFFLANIFLRDNRSLSLESIYSHYWLSKFENFHRAMDDTMATMEIFLCLLKEFNNLSTKKLSLLNYIFSKSKDSSVNYYLDYLNSDSDSEFSDTDLTSYFNKKLKNYSKTDFISNPDIDFSDWNYFNIDNFKTMSTFEVRDNQKKMWEIVWNSLVNNTKELIEAPTWVWKTFAYLLPSILYSLKYSEQVVISTKTKALQDQICYKDIKTLHNLWLEFNYCKLKWKQNYIWVYSFLTFLIDSTVFNTSEVSLMSKLALWLIDTKNWELEELNFYPFEYETLKTVSSDNFMTLDEDNPYKRKEFLFKARKDVESANVIIVNHSLLLQDIKSDSSLFWDIKSVVIDESHSFEDVSTEALKLTFNHNYLEDVFVKIENIIKLNKEPFWELNNIKEDFLFNSKTIFDLLLNYLSSEIPWLYWQRYTTSLLTDNFYDNYIDDFTFSYNIIDSVLTKLINFIWELDDKIYMAVSFELDKLEEFVNALKIYSVSESKYTYIRIVSYSDHSWVNIAYTYLNPGLHLKDSLWNKKDSVILTSATLSIWGKFDYISNLLQLDAFNTTSLSSDFDYSTQALLYVPNNIWSIKNNSHIVNEFLWNFLTLVKWNTLILSTSFNSIKEIYVWLACKLKSIGTTIFAQSFSWWKHKLIDSFKANSSNSVIVWTDTFWEWIDIPWEDLKYLVINKLPFSVPSDPIFKARSTLYRDPFLEYSVPKAIIKLKQWFWRLIRTKKDKWIVILLDNRIIDSRWWNVMYNAFPSDIKTKVSSTESFLDAISSSLSVSKD